jgi:hypothetical protein
MDLRRFADGTLEIERLLTTSPAERKPIPAVKPRAAIHLPRRGLSRSPKAGSAMARCESPMKPSRQRFA